MNDANAIRYPDFSVLLPVYAAEKEEYLDACLTSIAGSTCRPRQVVIVEDGPITPDLQRTIDRYRAVLPIDSVRLATHAGLAMALNTGLGTCRHELVARCDADDINRPDRFQRELALLESHPEVGVVGADTAEFTESAESLSAGRQLPSDSTSLARYARTRNPVNHPSAMFRLSVIKTVGGYPNYRGFEDYGLWVRCLNRGIKLMNIPEALVWMRTGPNQFVRRRGIRYAGAEIRLAKYFYDSGFLDLSGLALFLSTRIPLRLLPPFVVSQVYRRFLRPS